MKPTRSNPPLSTGNLLPGLTGESPPDKTKELVSILLNQPGLRIERIVSTGQTSPPDLWYDQPQSEWVLLVSGAALLRIDGESSPRHLATGDWINLPAHCRHRVEWTDPEQQTVWLALHYSEPD